MSCFSGMLKKVRPGWYALCPPCHGRIPSMDTITKIPLPLETRDLLEATAIANDCTPEEIIRAAIEAFLESDKEPEDTTNEWPSAD